MGMTCSTHWGEDERIYDFAGEARTKETTGKNHI
jgi:hypothetical protein